MDSQCIDTVGPSDLEFYLIDKWVGQGTDKAAWIDAWTADVELASSAPKPQAQREQAASHESPTSPRASASRQRSPSTDRETFASRTAEAELQAVEEQQQPDFQVRAHLNSSCVIAQGYLQAEQNATQSTPPAEQPTPAVEQPTSPVTKSPPPLGMPPVQQMTPPVLSAQQRSVSCRCCE